MKTPEENTVQSELEDGLLSVGAQLRDAREAKGLSLHQVADILRLRASQVHALEEGDFSSLPGQTFVTGFLRSYANLLDLDAVAIVELYKNEEGGGLHAPSLAFPEPSTGGRIPGAGILLGTVVVALILLAGWFVYQESESLDFERVAELPEHLASKIRDLENELPSNASNVSGSAVLTQNQDGLSNTPVVAPIDAPELSPSQTPSAEAVSDGGDSTTVEGETPAEVSAGATEDIAAADETEADHSGDTSSALVSADGSAPARDSESAENAANSVSIATENTALSEAASVDQETSQTNSVATEATPEATEAAEGETTPQTADAPASYPQDTLDLAAVSQSGTSETPENPLPRTFGVENTDARVVVRATEESWVEVKAPDDKPVLSRVLRPGDVYMAPNGPDLFLTTGNAGGLEIRVDGQEIRSLGGTGTILREVPLVAESLLQSNGLQ